MNKKSLQILCSEVDGDVLDLPEENLVHGLKFKTSTKNLTDNRLHIFVASYIWENMYFEIDEATYLDAVVQMSKRCKSIDFNIKCKMSLDIVNMLGQIYSDYQGKLRKAFMLNKDIMPILRGEV